MKKYRIVSETNQTLTNPVFFIEVKKWYGWRKIKISDNNRFNYLTFKSYEDAENHMEKNYFLDGVVYKPYSNEYHYKQNTYFCC